MVSVSPPLPPRDYGIHLLKAIGIVFQAFMHSIGWVFVTLSLPVSPYLMQLPWLPIDQIFAGTSLIIAMTAGGVTRLMATMALGGRRITDVNWPTLLLMLFLLAMGESAKQLLVGQSFFNWNALHTIAVGLAVTLFLAQRSITVLWCATFTILFIAPFLADRLAPLWPLLMGPIVIPASSAAIAATVLWSVFVALLYNKMRGAMTSRGRVVLAVLWVIGCGATSQVAGSLVALQSLQRLPLGAITGAPGQHIWPPFPWASLIMFGFLIFDLVARYDAAPRILRRIFFAGAVLAATYETFASIEPAYMITHNAFFILADSINISAIWITISIFCMLVPVTYYLAQRGWQTPYVVAVSRSVLWLYAYQTVPLWLIALATCHWLPPEQFAPGFIAFGLISTLIVPWGLRRLPLSITFSLRRSRHP